MEEEYQEDYQEYLKEISSEIAKKKIQEFKDGCNEAYEIIKERRESLDKVSPAEVKKALRRMLGYFLATEEYEKCSFIKDLYISKFNEDISPVDPILEWEA
jgi:hypothetical protein